MRSLAVTESSQVAAARRAAVEMAGTLGADETAAGKVAIVATELCTNIVKHGGGGELLLSKFDDSGSEGIELIALDRGRGIADVAAARRDGFSTAGSAGHGLGAVHRQSQSVEVASWPAVGTAILARVSVTNRPSAPTPTRPTYGAVCIPKQGEEVCGDAWAVLDSPLGRTLLVADGLGHGPQAATASVEAIRLFTRHQTRRVPEILDTLHNGLRATRGAAVAIARFEAERQVVIYGGIGNIAGAIVNGTETRRMISLNGTAGHVARRIQTFDYPYSGGLVIMHSDGLATAWSLDRYPGITRMHPTLIAAVLYRDCSRGRDDVTVLVAVGR